MDSLIVNKNILSNMDCSFTLKNNLFVFNYTCRDNKKRECFLSLVAKSDLMALSHGIRGNVAI